MRLSSLDPRWCVLEANGPRIGLTFLCPHCQKDRIGVAFHHTGHEAMEDAYIKAHSPFTNHIWTIVGDDLENITLSPSIDASASGHWHGFVTNGECQ